jgi:hypothetical protein
MGYQVENYSVSELHRISVPSTVAPCLFWVLPVGNWRAGELHRVWQWFTEQHSICNGYGLLLVKEGRRREDTGTDVSLASVGADLSDLMPLGAKRFVSPSALDPVCQRVLVLSGGYPQPGWGLLIDWSHDVRAFDALIDRILTLISSRKQDIRVFAQAADSFHRWEVSRRMPEGPDLGTLEREIENSERDLATVRDVKVALDSGDYLTAKKRLFGLLFRPPEVPKLEIAELLFRSLKDAQQRLHVAAEITSVSAVTIASEIEPQLARLIEAPSMKEEIFKQLPNEDAKRALRACRLAHEKLSEVPSQGFHSWAQQELEELRPQLTLDLEAVNHEMREKQIARRGELSQIMQDYDRRLEQQRQRAKQAREEFHRLANRAAELQWELGPSFLVMLEDICREETIWARSIPWDPARMVGWKIIARDVSVGSLDLQTAARELSNAEADEIPGIGQASGRADGSYFTDYVHYIAMTKPGTSPRAVTCDLVARLLRPTEMTRLIQSYGAEAPPVGDAKALAESLLDSCGWLATNEVREKPLARFLTTSADGAVTLADGTSGNDLRIALESFCKDLVDVVVTQLGYSHDEIWRAIDEQLPGYRPSSRRRDWDEEVRQLTTGPAGMLLSVLGTLAFPSRQTAINEFVRGLNELGTALNKCSHHRHESLSAVERDDLPRLLRHLLDKAQEVLGDLPWHLHTTFSYGEQPKVVSGEAWSHGSSAPRLLRVIMWSDVEVGTHILLWNRKRQNPIVTDPVLVRRPLRN